jgi:GNAT superfamily N-acetyltransferase
MMTEGLEYYRSFLPAGWEPPPADDPHGLDPDLVCLLAEDDAGLAGQVTVRAAGDAELGHLSNLFVREDLWGGGLARQLHEAALDAARERGFAEMRLYCAAGQARARRFYEREGWAVIGEPFFEDRLGLDLVEYRRAL